MDLANGLWPVRVPEVIHHLAFQIAQVPQHGYRPSLSGALWDLVGWEPPEFPQIQQIWRSNKVSNTLM